MIETGVVVENFSFESERIAPGERVRFTQMSDIHAGSLLPTRLWNKAVNKALECRPDFFTITGDLISRDARNPERLENGIRRMSDNASVFACLGNHDIRYDGDKMERLLRSWGVTVLRDESVRLTIDRSHVRIIGLRDVRTEKIDLDRAFRGIGDDEFALIMAHNPDSIHTLHRYVKERGALPAELIISGHTHGGQICLPIIGPLGRTSKMGFVAGEYERCGARMYVNRGIGTVTSPFRINSTPEVTLFTVSGKVGAEPK